MHKLKRKLLMEKSYLTGKLCLPPEFLSLLVTWKCNFSCRTCSIWKKGKTAELEKEDWSGIAKDLKSFFPAATFVEINGGEPLIRKDLVLELVKDLKRHFAAVTLNSNGSLLDEGTIRDLEQAGLDTVKISFYSLHREIHNFLRGHEEAYSKALRALKLLSHSRLKTEAAVLVTAQNIQEIPALAKFLLSAKNIRIILQPLDESIGSESSRDLAKNEMLSDLWPQRSEVKKFFSWALANGKKIKNSPENIKAMQAYYLSPKKVLKLRCFAGQRNCTVYPDGNVALCFKGGLLGNLQTEKMAQLLSAGKAVRERKAVKKCRKFCRIIGCNFSRGLWEILAGKGKF